jgi:hypothetical protein
MRPTRLLKNSRWAFSTADVLGTMPDRAAAKELGRTLAAVQNKRLKSRIPTRKKLKGNRRSRPLWVLDNTGSRPIHRCYSPRCRAALIEKVDHQLLDRARWSRVFGSLSVIVSVIPRLKESHVVPGLKFHGPNIAFVFWLAWDEAKCSTKPLH